MAIRAIAGCGIAGFRRLQPQHGQAAADWRFASTTLVRARRIVQLEQTYDADPQLAALAADLMEEVARLRRQLGDL